MFAKATRIITIVWVALTFVVMVTPVVDAQSTGFSGSDPSNYTCPGLPNYGPPTLDSKTFLCTYPGLGGKAPLVTNATIKPPTIKVLQYWFMRILYGAWAASGVIFTLIMVYLGFTYMTSQGDPGKLEDVKKRIRNWFIGLVLIFLAYPVLNTLFRIIGVSQSECFSQLQLPAFQFFFPDACTGGSSSSSQTPAQG